MEELYSVEFNARDYWGHRLKPIHVAPVSKVMNANLSNLFMKGQTSNPDWELIGLCPDVHEALKYAAAFLKRYAHENKRRCRLTQSSVPLIVPPIQSIPVDSHIGSSAAVSLRLRFLLFKRDGYRCQMCGRSPGKDNVKLEAGHKLARARGGSDSLDNLLTLCFECNRGQRTDSL